MACRLSIHEIPILDSFKNNALRIQTKMELVIYERSMVYRQQKK